MMNNEPPPNEVELVYGYLLSEFMHAYGTPKQDRIFAAIEIMEELWPLDTKKWRERCTPKDNNEMGRSDNSLHPVRHTDGAKRSAHLSGDSNVEA